MRTDAQRKCAYCGGSHHVSSRVAAENPFCNVCLPERVARRASQLGKAEIVVVGDYLMVTRRSPEHIMEHITKEQK